jgi:DNA-directed RNA polymerase specialized sigma24 family protein
MAEVDRTESFQNQRALMFVIAYRMLGSAAEADDVLQDAWLRAESADGAEIRSDKAWLPTVVTRLCLDRLKSARATRRLCRPLAPRADRRSRTSSTRRRSRSRSWSCSSA